MDRQIQKERENTICKKSNDTDEARGLVCEIEEIFPCNDFRFFCEEGKLNFLEGQPWADTKQNTKLGQ